MTVIAIKEACVVDIYANYSCNGNITIACLDCEHGCDDDGALYCMLSDKHREYGR